MPVCLAVDCAPACSNQKGFTSESWAPGRVIRHPSVVVVRVRVVVSVGPGRVIQHPSVVVVFGWQCAEVCSVEDMWECVLCSITINMR